MEKKKSAVGQEEKIAGNFQRKTFLDTGLMSLLGAHQTRFRVTMDLDRALRRGCLFLALWLARIFTTRTSD